MLGSFSLEPTLYILWKLGKVHLFGGSLSRMGSCVIGSLYNETGNYSTREGKYQLGMTISKDITNLFGST